MRAYPAVLLLVLAALGGVGPPARAGCVGPELRVEQRGASLEVVGARFHTGCADTFSCTGLPGCERCTADDPEAPLVDVPLELHQGDRVVPLGEVDAGGDDHGFRLTAEVPQDLRGQVVVVALTPSGDVRSAPLTLGGS